MILWLWYSVVAVVVAPLGLEMSIQRPDSPVGGITVGIALLAAYLAGGAHERLG